MRGEERRGEERGGEARRGEARRGEARREEKRREEHDMAAPRQTGKGVDVATKEWMARRG
jgi:hypothetical protein